MLLLSTYAAILPCAAGLAAIIAWFSARHFLRHLKGLADAAGFLASADSGTIRLDFSRVDLSLLCREIVEDIRTIAEPKSIAVTADVEASVFLNCDVHLIRRLLLNLLNNALKYNHANGWIRLQIGLKAGLAVIIAVANSGPKIPTEHPAHLFEPFYRADTSRSRRTGGTGLGLSICREIVALHQGTFKLRESTSEETVFEVSLPTI
jgi:two-component system sensor histidine kinase BaeS